MADSEQNKVADFVNKVVSGDNAGAGEAFKDALKDKVGTELDKQRQGVAGNLFNTAAISDPKPVVTDPADTTAKIMGTDGQDITQQVAPDTPPQPSAAVPETETPAEAPAEAPADVESQ
jgi:hypothetical protein|tara:strand:+ start:856 stop:1212 length:357 start_codon:yes stop_codon:yes gene_type:complete